MFKISLSSLHKCHKCKHEYCKHRNTAKETNHISLNPARFNMSYIPAKHCNQPRHPVYYPIYNIHIESLGNMRKTKNDVTNDPVVKIIHIEFMQEHTIDRKSTRLNSSHQ